MIGPASAFAAGSISGTVTSSGDGEPIADVEVCAEGVGSTFDFGCTETGAEGTYAIAGLESGDYKVEFWAAPESNYRPQYYNGKATWQQADVVAVVDDADTPDIDAALEEGGWIEGQVVDAVSKAGLGGIVVCAIPIDEPGFSGCDVSEGDGDYTIFGLAPDSYEVAFFPLEEEQSEYLVQFYDGKSSWFEATPVEVVAGSGQSGIDAEMRKGGQITGTVTDSVSGAGVGFSTVCVREPSEGEVLGCTRTSGGGRYEFRGVPTGSYKVWFSPDVAVWEQGEELDDYFQQYYNAKQTFAQADPVAVVAPGIASGIDARLVSRRAVSPAPIVTPPIRASTGVHKPKPNKPRRCPKGKRKVKVKGKVRCVKKHRKHRQGRQHAKRDLFHRLAGERAVISRP